MSKAAIARGLGMTRQTFHQHEQRGCPADSVEGAKAWLAGHVRPRRGRKTTAPASAPRPADIAKAAEGAELLEDICELRAIARDATRRAAAAGDDYGSRQWSLARTKIVGAMATAEAEAMAVQRQRRELLTVAEAREIFGAVLLDVRKLLDAAPAALAGRVSPADPDHAREILESWRTAMLRTLHGGEAPVS
jgi:hypothetical protein